MKKRRVIQVEQLEARVTPDVSFGKPVAALVQPPSNSAGSARSQPADLSKPSVTDSLPGDSAANGGHLAQDASYLQAVGRIFSNTDELERIFRSGSQPLPGAESAFAGQAVNAARDAGLAAWRFLSNYSKKAISNDEARYGSLSDREDLIHQIYVEWLQQVKDDNGDLSRVMKIDSAERQVLRKTVRRVLDHARYEHTKQRRMVELIDQAAPSNAAEQEWLDMQIDTSTGTLQLGSRERRMLELRREGRTFEEIGLEMGLLKQRVSEMYSSAISSLQDLYAV
jgi:RNA polymerase sigma factor (sigma-70 family)